ncbi:rhodanese-like domain-containing protein [Reichenbachiella sp.]|uniref:rhodanese-like domain-containing protein n=1 Tax=Reichenbachiella sp. TaxID=2184521 RepID=UPI003296E6B6
MKTLSKFLTVLLAISVLFVSCKDDDEITPTSSFETLTTYMVNNDLDLTDVLDSWIVGAPAEADLSAFLSSYYILDLRSSQDFADGHIEGAVNTTLTGLLEVAAQEPVAANPILVVCYTGQSAGHAVTALRLSGYEDAKVLKWGMSGWNSNFSSPWANNSGLNGDHGKGHQNWTKTATATRQTYQNPSWSTTTTDPPALLRERVNTMLQNGFKGVSCTDVLADPGQYFINNYWAEADVATYGHIDGSHRIHPMSIASGDFTNLDPDQKMVTYCWTGQTSSMVTAYLNVLGYDAQSLKFGVNSMIYSDLQGHKFVTPTVDLPVVTD